MAERNQHSRRHAIDHGLVDPHHAVVGTRQAAEGAPEAERYGSCDDAERRIAFPRRLMLLPELAACLLYTSPSPRD